MFGLLDDLHEKPNVAAAYRDVVARLAKRIAVCPFRCQGRKLAVADGVAYVTGRAGGVYIIDVHDPRKSEMLCHYDCIELATGVEVHGDLLFIAQRQYGVEIVNPNVAYFFGTMALQVE